MGVRYIMETINPRRKVIFSTCTGIKSDRSVRLFTILTIFLILMVPVADAAEYAASPPVNRDNVPGILFNGEVFTGIQPVPVWLDLILVVFPALTAVPVESFMPLTFLSILRFREINPDNILKNQKRLGIYNYIKENPGMYFREISRNTGLRKGTAEYHLKMMESEGLIKSCTGKGRLHYFINNPTYSGQEMELISVLRDDSLRAIVTEIYRHPEINNTKIAEITGYSESTTSKHLGFIREVGIIEAYPRGGFTMYHMAAGYGSLLEKYIR